MAFYKGAHRLKQREENPDGPFAIFGVISHAPLADGIVLPSALIILAKGIR